MAPLHIDTDGGVDDALALVMLAHAGAKIAAVSSVFGNTWVDQAASNANMVLRQSLCVTEVFVGAGVGLSGLAPDRDQRGHGQDGLNGQGGSFRRKFPPLQRAHGFSRLAMAQRSGIQGLFLGPLTNLALGMLDDPGVFRGWAPVVMAGAFAVEGRGADGADFNTWSDPEAMQRVLLNGVTPRLVPLDITSQVLLERAPFMAAAQASTWPLMQRLARAAGPYMDFHARVWGGDGCRPHDAVAAAAVLWPELFEFEAARVVLEAERRGRLRRGDGPANAEVCVAVDAAAVRERMLSALFSPAPAGAAGVGAEG
ncbi:nucleoside hydrolase [Caulobacter sp. KR2-114]|uniref:nucleoside hydrolase n=1 Tax=Caulobacter sp. KR2-114 TaxID=3400912 RepID=UPI003C015481